MLFLKGRCGGSSSQGCFPTGLADAHTSQNSASPCCLIFNKNVNQDVAGSHERPGDSAGSGAVVSRTADFHRAGPLGLVARDREELQASSFSSRGFFSGGGQRVGM